MTGIDWETILGCEDSERFEDYLYDDDPAYEIQGCTYDTDYENLYRWKDYACGQFKGKRIRFKRSFASHIFSDDEVRELLEGNTLSIEYETKDGQQRRTKGHLQLVTSPARRVYYGFIPEFDVKYTP